jgi:hypothetical protein
MTSARRALWSEALSTMGLVPVGAERGVVRYVHAGLEVRVGLLDPALPIELYVHGQPEEIPFLLLPRQSALVPPALRTGDPAFDEEVALILGGDVLLARLGPAQRKVVQEAVGLGAQLDATGAWLAPQAAARLTSAREIGEAIARMRRAVMALRSPPLDEFLRELLRRSLTSPDTPQVDQAARTLLERALPALPASMLGPVTSVLLRHGVQELPDELVDRALSVWREHERQGVVDILCEVLRRQGPGHAFHQLWERSSIRRDALVCKQVLQAVLERDPREWSRLVLALVPVARTPFHSGARLRVRGQEMVLLAVVQRVEPPWLSLLLSLHAHDAPDALVLAELLAWFDDPRVPARLMELLPLHQEAIAAVLAQRAHRYVRMDRTAEFAPVTHFLDGPLGEALLELPDEALAWIVRLVPRNEELRLRWIARLGRAPGLIAEQGLLPCLEAGSLRERRAAAQALGAAGGQRSLDALDLLARSWLMDGELRTIAQTSARAIRARHAPGGLSLASGEGGELSPASGGKTGPRGP